MIVPVIDLSDPDRARLAAAIDDALTNVGFMAITGHGIDAHLIESMFATVAEFFSLPLAEKLAVAPGDPRMPRGYSYVGATAQAAAHEEATAADLNETFNAGLDPIPDTEYYRRHAEHFPSSLWPTRPAALRRVWREYMAAMQQLCGRVLSLMATALELDEHWFDGLVDRPMSSITANHYPALDHVPRPDQFRGGAHTDYGTITILATDGVPGLQLLDEDGSWSSAPDVPGAFHVNTGDMLSHWSGGRWRSTWHRVVTPPGPPPYPERTSIVYFHSPNADTVIAPLPGHEADVFAPVTAGEYLRAKLDRYYLPRTATTS